MAKGHNKQTGIAGSHQTPATIMGPRIMLLLSVLALLIIGFVMLYSASSIEAIHEGESAEAYVIRQLAFGAVGIVVGVLIWKLVPSSIWSRPMVLEVVWAVTIVLLVLTVVVGDEVLGAKRRLSIGSFSIQPSEFAKIVFVLFMARILNDLREGGIDARRAIIQSIIFIIIPVLFLYQTQSDLGTTLICFAGVFTVLWLGEVPRRYILLLIGGAIVFALFAMLVGYRADRLIFIDPWQDYYGAGYQLIHSFYAFAEGGLFGVGLGNSREKFLYLPEAETDFIFAIIGEELGLLGALTVILLFLIFLYAGLQIARSAPDGLSAMIAGGCTVMIVFQAFLNIGCVIGILPTTGKPLPFISSGGSSLIACLMMVGIILSVSRGSDGLNVYEQRRQDLRILRAQGSSQSKGAVSGRRKR